TSSRCWGGTQAGWRLPPHLRGMTRMTRRTSSTFRNGRWHFRSCWRTSSRSIGGWGEWASPGGGGNPTMPGGRSAQLGGRGARHKLAMNVGHVLAMSVMRETGIMARSEKPGLLGRSSWEFVSKVDREEARECGRAAVRAALAGETGKMVALVGETGPEYRVKT